jgi:putative Holliday junction resolvase
VKVLALDFGAARTGVAVSDATGTIAQPLDVVERAGSRDGLARVALPLTLGGQRGTQALETEAFVRELREALDVPVETYDERFTTALASRGSGTAPEDARAAAHLLESYLARAGSR